MCLDPGPRAGVREGVGDRGGGCRPEWARSRQDRKSGERAGLVAALKGVALEVARDNVTIHNLLPERFDTERQIYMAKQAAVREAISYDEARAKQVESIAARRLGRPAEFGAVCAFLCS